MRVYGLNFFGSGKGGATPPLTDFFPVLVVLTLSALAYPPCSITNRGSAFIATARRTYTESGSSKCSSRTCRGMKISWTSRAVCSSILSIVLERPDVGRDAAVVDIHWGFEKRDIVNFVDGVAGVTFKRNEATDDGATDFPTVLCDRMELIELALTSGCRNALILLKARPGKRCHILSEEDGHHLWYGRTDGQSNFSCFLPPTSNSVRSNPYCLRTKPYNVGNETR